MCIRDSEKILLYYDKEIPYSVEVVVEHFKEDAKIIQDVYKRQPYVRGYTRVTMGGTEGSYTAT